ncbi:MAG: DUF3179 domain-containing protein [Acidimicrobiales bacterium]
MTVGALILTACANSGSDSDEAGIAAVESSEVDAGAGSESETDQSDDQQAPDDQGSNGGQEQRLPDPGFDYSTVDYDAEPAADALRGDRVNANFPPPIVEPSLITSGGPPPDGIPPIDSPNFITLAETDFLNDQEAVIAVEIEGEARAYPVQILIWHEIVNDQFGDVPVAITYCPLCNSALAFDRRLGNRTLDFGTSGELYQSALVMYDRQTGSLWAHFTGQGLVGHYAGAELEFIAAQTISFEEFKKAYPDGLVLSRDTGADRRYGQNPYPGYDDETSDPIGAFFNGAIDRTLLAKARIVGIADEAGSAAVRLDDLVGQPVIPVTDGGRNLVVFHQPGLNSTLDSGLVDDGRDVGQTGVFVAAAEDGTELTFASSDSGFIDDQTGSTWSIVGTAIDGPLAGQRLEAVSHLDTFWFAWATYRPDTVIIEP